MNARLVISILASASLCKAADLNDYNRAWHLYAQGRFVEAIHNAQSIISSDPNFFRPYELITKICSANERVCVGEQYFSNLADVDIGNPWPLLAIGQMREARSDRRAAQFSYAACVQRSADSLPCYEGLGRTSTSEKSLIKALPPGASNPLRLLALATFYRTSRRIPEAIEKLRLALSALEEPRNSEAGAMLQEAVALFLLSRNRDYLDALPYFETAYDYWIRVDDWDAQERLLHEIASTNMYAKHFDAVELLLPKLRERPWQQSLTVSQAAVAGFVAAYRLALGDSEGALAAFLEEKSFIEPLGMRLDRILLPISALYDRRGDAEKALLSLKQAWAASSRKSDRAYTLRSIGVYYYRHGDYFKSLEYGKRSLELFQELGMPLQAGAGLRNLAEVYAAVGDFSQSVKLTNTALYSARLRNDAGEEQGSLSDLGNLHARMGNLGSAIRELRAALSLSPHTSYEAARIETLLSLSSVYRKAKDWQRSLNFANEGVKAARAIQSSEAEAHALITLGEIQLEAADMNKAASSFFSAGEIAKKISAPDSEIASYKGLAEIDLKASRYARAAENLKLAVELLEAVRSSTPGADLRSSLISQNWAIYNDLIYALSRQGEYRAAFDYAERSRARAFLDVLVKAGAGSSIKQAETSGIEEIQSKMLAMDAVLLEYIVGDRASFLWIVSGRQSRMSILPGRSDLAAKVKEYRDRISLAPSGTKNEYREQGRVLYDMLCGQANPEIQRASRLIIIPDGNLHYLPFESLVTPSGKFLVESVSISYAPSASALLGLARHRSNDHRLEFAGFGAPADVRASEATQALKGVYRRAGFTFLPLPNALEELNSISRKFPVGTTKLWVGDQANLSALRTARLIDFKILHFSTHAIVDEMDPNRSGIVLTPAADGSDEGVLGIREILKLRLDCSLVVLSGCQTGLGRLVRGEGVDGLSRAFLSAGAERILVSDWKVRDLAAADFMNAFYRELTTGEAPAQALRKAKLAMLNMGSPAYRHPYYWAPFVMIGNF